MWDTPIPGIIPAVVILGAVLLVLAFSFRDRTRRRSYHDDSGDPAGFEFGDTGDSSCDGGDGGGGDGGGCD